MTGPLLTVTRLTVGYTRPTVGPVSFALARGERLGVWGPAGCGKSALLRAVARGATVFGGNIRRASGLSVAFQEQSPIRTRGLPVTVREYLSLAEALEPRPPPRFESWYGTRLDQLNSHEFQLIAVWAALASSADLILLDEPTGALDLDDRNLMLALIEGQTADRGMLIASHSWAFLNAACTRILEVGEWT